MAELHIFSPSFLVSENNFTKIWLFDNRNQQMLGSVCNTIHHLPKYMGSALNNGREFRIVVGVDLLPSTGFKMNFLVK